MYRAISFKDFNLSSILNSFQRVKCASTIVAPLESKRVDINDTNAKPFSEIPRIPSLPFIGTTWTLLPIIGKYDFRKLHKANESKYLEYGNIVREDITKYNKFVHIYEPPDFEKVYRNEGVWPERQPLLSFLNVIKEKSDVFSQLGLFTSNGEEWYKLRSKVQKHMLKPRTAINFLKFMDEVAGDFVNRMKLLRDPESLEINNYANELNKFSLESICLVSLDTRIGCLDPNLADNSETMKFVKAVSSVFDMMYNLEFRAPFWRFYPTPLYKKFALTVYFCIDVSQKYLNQARERLEKNEDHDRELSLLELILKENLDPRDINVVINDMFFAGIDTTSNTAAFFFYHMAKNPKAQEKLYAEIKRLLPDSKSPITKEVLNEARYLKSCLKESMRLLPVAGVSIRKLAKDTVLAGYKVPAGTQVLMHNMVASKKEKYFKDPLTYRPERWLRDDPEYKEINYFSFMPFGFGPRACIGRRIVEQELFTLIIRVFQKFRVEYHHEDMDMYTRLFNVPDKPLRYAFHDRV